ncbi:predicted protein [Histoplasma capsulatum H143]|uniref:Uncharacterized protein n=1 Tax=Ajellomyces capsulatus (strain H143) TaxID=544712 RepID=C6HQF9_AJECH|nr:predicted protein [Histoplasma capsulatum H143]
MEALTPRVGSLTLSIQSLNECVTFSVIDLEEFHQAALASPALALACPLYWDRTGRKTRPGTLATGTSHTSEGAGVPQTLFQYVGPMVTSFITHGPCFDVFGSVLR